MNLFVLRHGQATMQAATDFDRPLTAFGRQQVQTQAKHFADAWCELTAVYVSPLRRAQETAQALQQQVGLSRDLFHTVDWLRPETPLARVQEQLLCCEGDTLLVSHQPLVSTLTASLCGQSPWQLAMDTASVALLRGDCCVANGMLLEAVYDPR